MQELLAPKSSHIKGIKFFSYNWQLLGTKADLSQLISDATGVPKEYLEGKSLDTASISMRMSWAADRQATRAEDIAYALLGIFDVNMPLLYGEGKRKAFHRLQEEIMKVSEDETIFAWESTDFTREASSSDVLASDPRDFREARDLVPFASQDRVVPYTMTPRGLRIGLLLVSVGPKDSVRDKIRPIRSPVMVWSGLAPICAILRCHVAHDFDNLVMIPLQHITSDIYLRVTSTTVALIPRQVVTDTSTFHEVYIRNSPLFSITTSVRRRFGFLLRTLPPGFGVVRSIPQNSWDHKDRILHCDRHSASVRAWHVSISLGAILRFEDRPAAQHTVFLSLGFNEEAQEEEHPKTWCHLDDMVRNPGDESLEAFHRIVRWKAPRSELDSVKFGDDTHFAVRFRVKIHSEFVLGQPMFVVDITIPADGDGNG